MYFHLERGDLLKLNLFELEVDNQRVGTDLLYKNPDYLLKTLKKCIRIIMSGLQKTKFPISYLEQNLILQE